MYNIYLLNIQLAGEREYSLTDTDVKSGVMDVSCPWPRHLTGGEKAARRQGSLTGLPRGKHSQISEHSKVTLPEEKGTKRRS